MGGSHVGLTKCSVPVCGAFYDRTLGGCTKERCPRCFKRKRRGLPDAPPSVRLVDPRKVETQIEAEDLARLKALAGGEVGPWLRDLIRAALAAGDAAAGPDGARNGPAVAPGSSSGGTACPSSAFHVDADASRVHAGDPASTTSGC